MNKISNCFKNIKVENYINSNNAKVLVNIHYDLTSSVKDTH